MNRLQTTGARRIDALRRSGATTAATGHTDVDGELAEPPAVGRWLAACVRLHSGYLVRRSRVDRFAPALAERSSGGETMADEAACERGVDTAVLDTLLGCLPQGFVFLD